MGIGDIGWSEFLFLLALALILLGPRRLPEVARALGRGLREFRRALNEVQEELRRETPWTAWTEDWSPARGPGTTPAQVAPRAAPARAGARMDAAEAPETPPAESATRGQKPASPEEPAGAGEPEPGEPAPPTQP